MPVLAPVSVRSVERPSPSFVRIELGGPALADFGVDGPTYDQRFKLLLPGPAGLPTLPEEGWWAALQALPEGERCVVRTYTIREVRGRDAGTRIVVDLVLHPGAHGPGSAWAAAAAVGDEVMVCVPRRGEPFGGIEWDPGHTDRLLVVGDETAVPAVASILGSLPGDAGGAVFLEVPEDADVQELAGPAGVVVTWLPRSGAPVGSRAVAAVADHLGFRSAPSASSEVDPDLWETPTYSSSGEPLGATVAPTDDRYAWIAGEAGMVTTLRRHLVGELRLPRHQVAFMGYWRTGVAMRG
ncbi:siderophore-interacting protein [Nocardioides panacisoli]|uniref:Siderophore-interacting protein n=1 Tax=Nocardioides panacisoli TaxID=627624 RepID=A0ABP7IHM3_9ACTN